MVNTFRVLHLQAGKVVASMVSNYDDCHVVYCSFCCCDVSKYWCFLPCTHQVMSSFILGLPIAVLQCQAAVDWVVGEKHHNGATTTAACCTHAQSGGMKVICSALKLTSRATAQCSKPKSLVALQCGKVVPLCVTWRADHSAQ